MKNRKKRNTALKILSNPITLKIFSIQFGCALFRAAFHYTLLRTNNPIKLKLDEKTNYTRLSLFNCLSILPYEKAVVNSFMPKIRTNVLKIFAKHTEHARKRGKRAIRQAVQRQTPVPARRFRSTVLRLFFCHSVLFVLRGVCLAAASEASRTCLCQAHATVPKGIFLYILQFCFAYVIIILK